MARVANRARRDLSFEVGDRVWLSTRNLPLKIGTRKLAAIFAGPYVVTEAVGPVAYRLELPSDWQIHDVFHVSQLKPLIGEAPREQEILVDGQLEYEVEKILDMRTVRNTRQFLVKWKSYEDYNNTWVKEEDLENAQEALDQYLSSQSRVTRTRRGSGVRVS